MFGSWSLLFSSILPLLLFSCSFSFICTTHRTYKRDNSLFSASTKPDFAASQKIARNIVDELVVNNIGKEQELLISHKIKDLISHDDGARGFFVTYLTQPEDLLEANVVPSAVSIAVSSVEVPDYVAKLCTMNVIMPTGMILAHKKNNDEVNSNNSRTTQKRALSLISSLSKNSKMYILIENNIISTITAIEDTGSGVNKDDQQGHEVAYWKDFMKKWGYDKEQQMMIKAALETIII